MKCLFLHRLPSVALRPQWKRVSLREGRVLRAEARWESLVSGMEQETSSSMPYDYDQDELQELADLMPPPLEEQSLPSSKIEMKRLLDKHGIRCDALFGTDFDERMEQEARRKAAMGDWTETRQDFDEMWPDSETKQKEEEEDILWPLTQEEKELEQMIDFGYQCMREHEQEQIFDKAMELHHSQRARARNIYAACMWYAKKLEAAEMQDNYEFMDQNPVPTYIRAMFTLEEEFEELNAKQYDVELKLQEQTREIEDAEYHEFLRGTVVTMPTKPDSPYHEIFNAVVEEPEEELPELDIDVYLHGTLPNASTDKGLPKPWKEDPDFFLSKLIFKEDELD